MGPRDSRYGPRYDNYGRGPSYDGRVYPSYGYNDERYYGDRRYDRGLDYRRDYDDRRMMYDSPGPYRGGYGGYGNEIMGLRSVEGLAQLVEYLSPEMVDLALRFCQQTGTPSVEVPRPHGAGGGVHRRGHWQGGGQHEHHPARPPHDGARRHDAPSAAVSTAPGAMMMMIMMMTTPFALATVRWTEKRVGDAERRR